MRQQTVVTVSMIVVVALTGVTVVLVALVATDVTVIAIVEDVDMDRTIYPCARSSNLCSSVPRKPA